MSTGFTFVDSQESIIGLIKDIKDAPSNIQVLYLDLEGQSLSRFGTVSLITVLLRPKDQVYIVDIFSLKEVAFDTKGSDGTTLKDILQSSHITKIFFDIRNDSDALYAHFDIKLQGVQDVQLMENASRLSGRKYLHRLERCVMEDSAMGSWEKERLKYTYRKWRKMFDPVNGESHQLIDARPLGNDIKDCCISGVEALPELHKIYNGRLSQEWKIKVEEETEQMVLVSQRMDYIPHDPSMVLGPWPESSLGYMSEKMYNDTLLLQDAWLDYHMDDVDGEN